MAGGFDSGGGRVGQRTLVNPPVQAQPEPGKTTRAAPALPRTTADAGAVGPEKTGSSSVERYSDMLAVVMAAKALTDRAKPGDPVARAQILALIGPLEHRLSELNDHQGRLAQFGAGNVAGQAALDMSEAAIRSWRQLLQLGTIVRTDELVTRFQVGAETLQFLTGAQRDAPTLREVGHVGKLTAVAAAVPVLAPPLVALAAGEAPLFAFVARVSARRVMLWAATQPAAALAASEVLLGVGVQIGEDGWEPFWSQLQDPQGRWFIIAQVLMDYMHIRGSLHLPAGSRRAGAGAGAEIDVEAARAQVAKARAAVQQVHDDVEAAPEAEGARHEAASASTKAIGPASVDQVADRPATAKQAATELLSEIERNAGGLRRPALETLEPGEIERLKKEFVEIGGDPEMLMFNRGNQTGYLDDSNAIVVRGDVNPREDSLHPRSAMSSKAALGHERGHAAHRGTKLPVGAWNDEFRASYWAAKNLANLSDEDRIHLVLDAMERAKEAGVAIRPNALMRKILYGY